MSSAQKIKVLYISHAANLYGAEQSLLLLLRELDRKRFFPVVVLPKDGPLKQAIEALSIPVEIVPSLRAWFTRRTGLQKFLYYLAIVPFIFLSVWKLKSLIHSHKIDLVHSNSLAIIDGALIAKLLKLPHIWHAREIVDSESVYHFLLSPCSALGIVLSLSDRVVAISKAVATSFCQCQQTSKVALVYNGVSLQQAAANPDSAAHLRWQYGINPKAPIVAQVANLNPVKGCEDFVHAAAQVHKAMPEVVFLLVGGAPYPDYKQKILDLVSDYHLESCFFLTGFRQDIMDIFMAINLLILPSSYEPFGRVVIEAMLAGRPVVGSAVGGIPEIIVDGVTGLLAPPHSPDRLAQAMIKILQDPALASRMGAAGYARAREHFSSEQYLDKIQKIYEEAVGTK